MMMLKLPREQKDVLIEKVQAFFQEERSEEIGALAAEMLLDYMIQEVGPTIYNQAIQDASRLVNERMVSIEEDLRSLEKRASSARSRR
ncbi:uncharacterized protein (DUF2164 family) [Paenibacillus phyllosphaerae]|uniref:Uncharacterized protein (DUF2164 family) n=1 Tax=Paenibacillus phyllosphaerae TaxID=274593 RepID=A0A7W5B1L3_9BACL|nr:DUF2164 domain-containing protein [Paenibacillus phyllosphaerae]MBB3112760.1 uncharacterized protein (DUF2164 family) [Paenibacillus phyllosphaerae]